MVVIKACVAACVVVCVVACVVVWLCRWGEDFCGWCNEDGICKLVEL